MTAKRRPKSFFEEDGGKVVSPFRWLLKPPLPKLLSSCGVFSGPFFFFFFHFAVSRTPQGQPIRFQGCAFSPRLEAPLHSPKTSREIFPATGIRPRPPPFFLCCAEVAEATKPAPSLGWLRTPVKGIRKGSTRKNIENGRHYPA